MPEALPLQPGDPRRLGAYEITGRLGVGDQGAVFLGADAAGRVVAVKLLHVRLSGEPVARSRFTGAFTAARKVSGFCTAAILDAEVEGDRAYVVSEWVDGPSLQQLVDEEGPRGGVVVERVAVGTAIALAAVHRAGALHHDLKPANVLLGRAGPRMSDFGIAQALEAVNAAPTGRVADDPAYRAPEQLSGQGIGPAADIFAWAATLLFAVTGKPPFGDDSPSEVMQRIVYDDPDLSPVPDSLREVLADALAKNPAERPTAHGVLERLLDEGGTLAGRMPASMLEEGRALVSGARTTTADTSAQPGPPNPATIQRPDAPGTPDSSSAPSTAGATGTSAAMSPPSASSTSGASHTPDALSASNASDPGGAGAGAEGVGGGHAFGGPWPLSDVVRSPMGAPPAPTPPPASAPFTPPPPPASAPTDSGPLPSSPAPSPFAPPPSPGSSPGPSAPLSTHAPSAFPPPPPASGAAPAPSPSSGHAEALGQGALKFGKSEPDVYKLDPSAFEATTSFQAVEEATTSFDAVGAAEPTATFDAVGGATTSIDALDGKTATFDAVGGSTAVFDAVGAQEPGNRTEPTPHLIPGFEPQAGGGRGASTGTFSVARLRRPSNHVLGVALSLTIGVGVGIAIIALVLWPQLKDDAPAQPRKTAAPAGNGPVAAIPQSFAGTWKGTVVNRNRNVSFPIEVTFAGGGTTAQAVYPREKCNGKLTLSKGTESSLNMDLSVPPPCTNGTVQITRQPDGTLQYTWSKPGTPLSYAGRLSRN